MADSYQVCCLVLSSLRIRRCQCHQLVTFWSSPELIGQLKSNFMELFIGWSFAKFLFGNKIHCGNEIWWSFSFMFLVTCSLCSIPTDVLVLPFSRYNGVEMSPVTKILHQILNFFLLEFFSNCVFSILVFHYFF